MLQVIKLSPAIIGSGETNISLCLMIHILFLFRQQMKVGDEDTFNYLIYFDVSNKIDQFNKKFSYYGAYGGTDKSGKE